MDENIFERWRDRKKKRQNHTRGWRLNKKEIDLADEDKIHSGGYETDQFLLRTTLQLWSTFHFEMKNEIKTHISDMHF